MKRIFYLRGWLMPALLILAMPVLAQVASTKTNSTPAQLLPVDTAKLAQAMALFNQGRLHEAEALFAFICKHDQQDPMDPNYVAALCYEAWCQHGLGNWHGFLKVMATPSIQQADIPIEIRTNLDLEAVDALNGLTNRQEFLRVMESSWFQQAAIPETAREGVDLKAVDAVNGLTNQQEFLKEVALPWVRNLDVPPAAREGLDLREIDVLFFYRKFDELLSKIAAFQANHADSPKLWAVAEYQMAGLYERGIAKLTEAGILKGDAATNRLTEGQANLTQFLNEAAALDETNYQALPGRDLPQEIVKAMTALGNDKAAGLVLPADREKTEFHSLELHCKLQPKAADDNLQRMTNFLNDFPDTKFRQRVQYEVADVVLNEARRLTYEEHNHVKAMPYLDKAQSLFSGVTLDEQAGISDADVKEAREKMLLVYYAQLDYVSLSSWAAQITTNSPLGGKEWLAAKLYDAAGLTCQKKFSEATNELDEILATGFKGNPSYDGFVVSAAEWRIQVARLTGDGPTAWRVAQQVQSSDCVGSVKRTFAKKFAILLAQPNPNSK